jgi:putative chitinase
VEVTADQLRILSPKTPFPLIGLAGAINAALVIGEITTPLRLQHFLAQTFTETGGMLHLRESLVYSHPERLLAIFPHEVHDLADATTLVAAGQTAIANRVYANRIGNGDEASGDGWKYRGGGMIQLTGRSNYRTIGAALGLDLEENPAQLGQFTAAALAAGKFWGWKDCNTPADADDIVGVTRKINPALAGLDARKGWLARIKGIVTA